MTAGLPECTFLFYHFAHVFASSPPWQEPHIMTHLLYYTLYTFLCSFPLFSFFLLLPPSSSFLLCLPPSLPSFLQNKSQNAGEKHPKINAPPYLSTCFTSKHHTWISPSTLEIENSHRRGVAIKHIYRNRWATCALSGLLQTPHKQGGNSVHLD